MKIKCEYCNTISLEEQRNYFKDGYYITILKCKHCGACKEIKEKFINCDNKEKTK